MVCKILLTDPPFNPSKNREKMVETMFEKYNFYWGLHSNPSLLAGLVIDSGDGVTHVTVLKIEVDIEAVLDVVHEVNSNGKTFTLKLKLKVKLLDSVDTKIAVVKIFWPPIGLPTILSFLCVEINEHEKP
ncbi:actin-related protein 2-like [Cucumis sativus]|uniref:actin-related protein 2-like n=1 Tax=Cucumis sativus TaxID=3659 RepID=UPI0012F4FE02|nr:actin-related protein 2-like [Cucumis sativus]